MTIDQITKLGTIYIKNGFKLVLTDRIILFIDLFIATGVTLAMQYLIWMNILSNGTGSGSYGLEKLIFYYLFTIALNRFNNGYSVIEDVSYAIYSGKIETALVKPVSFKTQKFFEYLGGTLAYLPLALIPLFIYLFYVSPVGIALWPAIFLGYLILLLLSQYLTYNLAFLISLLTVKTENSGIVLAVYSTLAAFLGGTLLPYEYWYSWLQPLMMYNPFYFTMGKIAEFCISPSLVNFLTCFVGIAVFIALIEFLCAFFWRKAMSNLRSLGG